LTGPPQESRTSDQSLAAGSQTLLRDDQQLFLKRIWIASVCHSQHIECAEKNLCRFGKKFFHDSCKNFFLRGKIRSVKKKGKSQAKLLQWPQDNMWCSLLHLSQSIPNSPYPQLPFLLVTVFSWWNTHAWSVLTESLMTLLFNTGNSAFVHLQLQLRKNEPWVAYVNHKSSIHIAPSQSETKALHSTMMVRFNYLGKVYLFIIYLFIYFCVLIPKMPRWHPLLQYCHFLTVLSFPYVCMSYYFSFTFSRPLSWP
jgi:hypothetical protein